ncbi:30S ribosomal protein S6 [Mycoplasma sp. 744]|uniref:30S ribosomal protein S6 n=1 Tax=Mycoplasma sp. 744 TaxID=3108531 RepID=UPI002B1DFB16|nr:30S ribosomal protein S6 [Mycoplasma sp. 744]MEA4115638.1 30S ribosomal protein S6 [Mycoplasma sp. 744]
MSKYEIMMIVDSKADANIGFNLVNEVFGKTNVKKAEKLENTDLAYEINGSTKAQYLVFLIEAQSNLIAEFIRRSNIRKEILRHLVINLDTEKGFGKAKKTFKKPNTVKKHFEKKDVK